jgi:adenylate cyclase
VSSSSATSLLTVGTDSEGEPGANLVMHADGGERTVPIFDQLFVGRECAGISERRRLVIRDPGISRSHLEIRLDAAADQAFIIDTSTNGTTLNGARLERAVPVPIKPNDQIEIGDVTLTFRSARFNADRKGKGTANLTVARIVEAAMVMVVGDITNYSTISEVTDNTVIATSLNHLWRELRRLLRDHRGTLNHYAGDAMYAVWELRRLPEANELAIDFALAASRKVEEFAPTLPLRDQDGAPIHMGWAVVQGSAAIAAMTRTVEAVIGDATNVAFRLSGIAGRAGRAAVMVTDAVHSAVEAQYVWGDAEQVAIKGRKFEETVYPVLRRTLGD